jgi:hypothetical protein
LQLFFFVAIAVSFFFASVLFLKTHITPGCNH